MVWVCRFGGVVLLFIAIVVGGCGARGPWVVAHRGASQAAPENTLPAFDLAWALGADAIEGDFYLSKDGVIVCIHDRNTKRVAGTNLVVKDATLGELKGLDVGGWHSAKYKGTRVPTIAEVFETVPRGGKIFIEVKCGVEIVDPLTEAIKASGLRDDQVVVICFTAAVIKGMKAKLPGVKGYWLTSVWKDKKTGELKPTLGSILKTLKRIGADGVDARF